MADYYVAPKSSFDATADAIREKTGSSADIEWTQDGFADAIGDIEDDNREDLCEPLDVDFIDYDGRLIYSYTAADFLQLESLPANPTNKGLVAQGWNWTLADAKEYVGQWGALVIGQNYTTNNGKTRIYIHISSFLAESGKNFSVVLRGMTATASINIDWGDDTVETKTMGSNGTSYSNHVYQDPGDYIISIEVLSGEIGLGHWGSNIGLVSNDGAIQTTVKRIEVGNGVTAYCTQPFTTMANLESVSTPITLNNMIDSKDITFFNGCVSLKGIVFAQGVQGRTQKMFNDNQTLAIKYISTPKSMTKIQLGTYMRSLRKVTMYSVEPVSSTNGGLPIRLYYSENISHFIIPGTYTTINNDTCRGTFIKKLTIPESVTAINGTATFSDNNYLEEVHLNPLTPPSLSNASAFNNRGANCIFYVPYSPDHSILEAYQTATNWSTYASYMQEESQ